MALLDLQGMEWHDEENGHGGGGSDLSVLCSATVSVDIG